MLNLSTTQLITTYNGDCEDQSSYHSCQHSDHTKNCKHSEIEVYT